MSVGELGETLVTFDGQFSNIVGEIDQKIRESKTIHVFYSGLDPLNEDLTKLRNNYIVKDINTMEKLVIKTNGYIDMENANSIMIPQTLTREKK